MLDARLLLAFTLAAVFVLLIPGPTVLTVVSYGLRLGPRPAGASSAGVVLGDALAVTLCLTGVGAVLAVSPLAFDIIKWCGVAYLLWLAYGVWRAGNAADDALTLDLSAAPRVPPGPGAGAAHSMEPGGLMQVFRQTFIVTALNPKGIVFFIAFIPQFVGTIDPTGDRLRSTGWCSWCSVGSTRWPMPISVGGSRFSSTGPARCGYCVGSVLDFWCSPLS